MEKELNIAEILKDKPKGTKLYADAFGKINFECISNNIIFTNTKVNTFYTFYDNGKYSEYGEPILVPSKEMRDWSKFSWKKGDVLQHSEYHLTVIFESFEDDTYTSFKCKYCFDFESDSKWLDSNSMCSTIHFYKVSDEEAKEFIKKVELNYNGKLNMKTLEIEKSQPEFKDGDIVYSEEDEERYPSISILNINNKDGKYYYLWCPIKRRKIIIYNVPLLDDEENRFRYATDAEKQQLFNALMKEGKRWNAEKKVIENFNNLEVTGDGVVESVSSAFTVSDLLHVLVDYVDDGMGYLEVYFNDKPINKASLRTINPQMTGTFEPYQEFVLSDKGGNHD